MRQDGYYWVQFVKNEWIVAQFFSGQWLMPGHTEWFKDSDFEEICEIKIPEFNNNTLHFVPAYSGTMTECGNQFKSMKLTKPLELRAGEVVSLNIIDNGDGTCEVVKTDYIQFLELERERFRRIKETWQDPGKSVYVEYGD